MSQSDSDELIAVCEEILEDDEVTVEEVFRLGEWINSHERARRSWPGEVLAPTIQEVLLDGEVTKTELRRVAALLRRTRREWVLRRQEKLQQGASEKALQAAKTMDLAQPKLPSIPCTLKVRSHGGGDLFYDVDLTGPSCNCPDWRSRRRGLPLGDLNRCCKHVLDAFNCVTPDGGWPGWLGAFLEDSWTPHPSKRWFVLQVAGHCALTSTSGSDWAEVFSHTHEGYQRFGYNVAEHRWAYGIAPTGAAEIVKAIMRESGRGAGKKGIGGMLKKFFGG